MQTNDRLFASEEVVACELDEGRALLDLRAGKYFKLNKSAGLIWDCLTTGATIEELMAEFEKRYDVEESQCRKDITAILNNFIAADLLQGGSE